ncbi:MAG: DUF427 domain-containing protein [Mesorhizobium sp.]
MDQHVNPSPGFRRNPDKVITVDPFKGRVVVFANGTIIASSAKAKLVTEPPYPFSFYIPFEDIDFRKLQKTELSTECPYRGDASHWNVLPAGETGNDAMWAYEQPYEEMAAIRNHGAFYPDRVTIDATPG